MIAILIYFLGYSLNKIDQVATKITVTCRIFQFSSNFDRSNYLLLIFFFYSNLMMNVKTCCFD